MASGPLPILLRQLRRSAHRRAAGDLTDAQLLERFVYRQDEAAFELLVRRHGTLVLNVCRRVLDREHDAEDAFQATFLTLARKAGAIGNRASVGSWLYKVAYRVALRARMAPHSRPLPEEPLRDPNATEPIVGLLWRELRSVLDEEVSRLPERYRAPFVLCHLEGQTTEAAARALGCPPGTVGTRLARARDLLRRRLARRGFGATVLAIVPNGSAAPPAALVDATVQAVRFGTADQAATAGVISAQVAILTKGALHTMSATKWTLATAVILALGLLGSAVVLAHRTCAVELPSAEAADAGPADEDTEPGQLFRWRFQKDRPFYQEVTTTTLQILEVMGNDTRQQQQQTFYFRWTPLERRPDGGWVVKQKVEGVKMDLDIGDNKLRFDSTREGDAPSPLADFCKALVGAEFRVTLDRRFRVRKVEDRDEFLDKVSRANPALGTLWPQILNADAMRREAETLFPALPEEPVRPGDSWAWKSMLDLGPLGDCRNTTTYTYEGREGQLDRIGIDCLLEYRVSARKKANLPFVVKEGKLERATGTGKLLFDRARGRLARLELELQLYGPVTLSMGRDSVGVILKQKQHITIKITDTNPLQRTPPAEDVNEEIERLRQENARLKRQLKAVEEALRHDGKPNE
jgi:RNA polymerase sigma factor (sigma-70 family)